MAAFLIGFSLFLASGSAASELVLKQLARFGFSPDLAQNPGRVEICGAEYENLQSYVNATAFKQALEDFHEDFNDIYAQNLRKFVDKTDAIYNKTSTVANRILSNSEYKQVFSMKEALIPFADKERLKAEVDALLEDSSCLLVQVALSERALCALAHGEPASALRPKAKGKFGVRGPVVAQAVSACAKNIELMCDIVHLLNSLGPEGGAKDALGANAASCDVFGQWSRCKDLESDCSDALHEVFQYFFSPTALVVTNGYEDTLVFGGAEEPMHYRVSITGLEIDEVG